MLGIVAVTTPRPGDALGMSLRGTQDERGEERKGPEGRHMEMVALTGFEPVYQP